MAEFVNRIPLKVQVCGIGVVDTLVNGWYLFDTVKFIHDTIQWILWKFAIASSLVAPWTATAPSKAPSELELTVHDKHKFMWLFFDSVFLIMLVLIETGAVGLIVSTCCCKHAGSSVRLINFWIRCNMLVATMAIITFIIRIVTTTFYSIAPIIIFVVGSYLSIRYKCVLISKDYQKELRRGSTATAHFTSQDFSLSVLS